MDTKGSHALVQPLSAMQSPEPEMKEIHKHGDAALDFLETHERITYTAEEEKAVIRKIDRVLMPLVSGALCSRGKAFLQPTTNDVLL